MKTLQSLLDRVESRHDFPNFAAALDYIRPRHDGIPTGVTLPNYFIEGPLTWPGQHAGFLGPKHDPWQIKQDPNSASFQVDSLALPVMTGVVVIIWIVVAGILYRDYGANLLASLRGRTLDPANLTVDDESTVVVIDRLVESDDERDVRLGLDILTVAQHP